MKKHIKDYFIPHEGNNYKPHSLQQAAMLAMVMMVLVSFVATNLHALFWISSDWLVSTVLPAVIVDLTNEERQADSLVQLRRNPVLDEAARLKAEDMARNEYFSHYSPTGVSPWYWFGEVNYNFVHAGENLAIHFTDSDEVVEAWMDSPTHRANIMNGNYREIGVGTAKGTYEGFDTVYVVQLFGAPSAVPSIAETPVVESPLVTQALPTVAGEELSNEESQIKPVDDVVVLAEAVQITEQVETGGPDPVLVESESLPVNDGPVEGVYDNPILEPGDAVKYEDIPVYELGNDDTAMVDSKNTEETLEVAEVNVMDDRVVVYSEHISTSTGGIPATIEDKSAGSTSSSFVGSLATQPHLILQYLYAMLALFVVISLTLAILVEIKLQHPLQIAYSVALLLLMYGLYQVHTYVVSGAVVI